MKKLNGYFALIIFILSLLLQYKDCNASDYEPQINSLQEQGGAYYASAPQCTSGLTEIIVSIVVIYVAGKDFILPAVFGLMFGSPSPFQKAIYTAQIAIGSTMILGTALSMSTSLQCFFAFVMDPRLTDKDDGISFLNSNGKPVLNRWEADYAPYSSKIKVCARPIMIPYVNLIGLGNNFSCYGTTNKWMVGKSPDEQLNNFYDGAKTFLCPEEWRFHKYRPEIRVDPADNKKEKYAKLGNMESEETGGDQEKEAMKSILDMRRNTGPLICKTQEAGDEFSIHGFKYRIIKAGPKICAQLQGLGDIPSISGRFIVGCHYGPPAPPAPMCEASMPIYLTNNLGVPAIDHATGEKIVVDYDNSACFSCYINDSCYNKSAIHSRAVVPVSSYIMECLHSTLNAVIFGCADSTGVRKDGMLYEANKNFKNLTYIALLLSVIFLAMKILFTNVLPKLSELFTYVFKVGVVLFFVNGVTEDSGMQWLYKQLTTISGGLGDIFLRAASFRNDVCSYQDNMYLDSDTSGKEIGNYIYLKPFDYLDCRVFFYLGGTLLGNDQSIPSNFGEVLIQLAPRLLMIIFPLFGLFDPIAFIVSLLLALFSILIISMVIWIVSLMVLSMILLFFLVLISPLIVPMVLFGYTKPIFDNWTKELVGYTLFPAMIFLFFGFILSIFDIKMLGKTIFEPYELSIFGRKAYYYVFEKISCSGSSSDPRCKSCAEVMVSTDSCDGCDPKALVCQFRGFYTSKSTTLWGQGNIIPEKSGEFFLGLLESMGYIILMALIFVTMLNTIAFLIGRLSGGSRSIYKIISQAISPMTMFMTISGKFASFSTGGMRKIWNVSRGSGASKPDEKKNQNPPSNTSSGKTPGTTVSGGGTK